MTKELTEQVYFKIACSNKKGRKKSTYHCMGKVNLNLCISLHIPEVQLLFRYGTALAEESNLLKVLKKNLWHFLLVRSCLVFCITILCYHWPSTFAGQKNTGANFTGELGVEAIKILNFPFKNLTHLSKWNEYRGQEILNFPSIWVQQCILTPSTIKQPQLLVVYDIMTQICF